ncbi:hypothetical protein EDF18_2829 [Frigoribacterium sp. PhB107]|jgi:hypothetical protein|uniref:hypothetical protein n=1 Tax=Frigoribacterium sp. PhB107 TaxID=2485172 RepID=UPI000FA0FF03|nr:hypothetical protein [Frigoribacterium sp. PhB107]ROP73465.1 hypothetical protein EDF18_2829 [Frigoribacterium sp. PhB107]
MSLYISDPRVHPASIGAYPKRRRPVTVLPPMRSARPPEPCYADFFDAGRTARAAAV